MSGQLTEHASAASPNEATHWRDLDRVNLKRAHLENVKVSYRFEELQNIRISIWDSTLSEENDFLGEIHTTLGDLVVSGITEKPLNSRNLRDNNTLLERKQNLRSITVIVLEPTDGEKLLVTGRFSVKTEGNQGKLLTGPYLLFSQVHVTEVLAPTRDPVWRPVQFKVDFPECGENSNIHLKIVSVDKDYDVTDEEEVGFASCTLEELLVIGKSNQGKTPLISSEKGGRLDEL